MNYGRNLKLVAHGAMCNYKIKQAIIGFCMIFWVLPLSLNWRPISIIEMCFCVLGIFYKTLVSYKLFFVIGT
jgi:hypothetical protein